MKICFVAAVAFMLAAYPCVAQLEITVGAARNAMLDELKDIYNPAADYALTIAKNDKYKKRRNTWGITLGYARFTPRDSVFYYPVNETETGKAHYGDYSIFQLMVAYRYDYIITDRLELFLGVDLGYCYVHYDYATADAYISEDGTTIESRIGLMPKGGVNFVLVKSVILFLQARYGASFGNGDNGRDQIVNSFLCTGGGVRFRFK